MKKLISLLIVLSMLLACFANSGLSLVFAEGGDLNNDGEVTTYDARLLLSYIVTDVPLTAAQKAAADLNGDGSVNTSDVKYLLYILIHGEQPVDLGTATAFNLLAPSLDTWNNPIKAVPKAYCTMKESGSLSSGYTFTNITSTDEAAGGSMLNPYSWPYASFCYDKKILLPAAATISFDFTVDSTAASFELYLGGNRPDVSEGSARKIVLNTYMTSNIASYSGDIQAGTYTGAVRVGDLISSGQLPSGSLTAGCLWVSGLKIFVTGYNNQTVTVRKLSVDQAYQLDNSAIYETDPYGAVRSGLILSGETEDLQTEITGMDFYINGRRSSLPSLTPNTNTDYKKTYHTQTMSRTF
ncbi:MAG: dockerin type I repeat-containing protein, partial [Clostridia bacterium]|nr:dockerin type I repeat-containing protein [Clostridia bacterium]